MMSPSVCGEAAQLLCAGADKKPVVLPLEKNCLGGVKPPPRANLAVPALLHVAELSSHSSLSRSTSTRCLLVSVSGAPLWIILSPTPPQTPGQTQAQKGREVPTVSLGALGSGGRLLSPAESASFSPAAALVRAVVGGFCFSSK